MEELTFHFSKNNWNPFKNFWHENWNPVRDVVNGFYRDMAIEWGIHIKMKAFVPRE